MDLGLIAAQARKNSERWFPDLHAEEDMKVFYGLALAGEVGELCNLTKKYVRHYKGTTVSEDDVRGELADVFTYLILLADEWKIDLLDAFEAKQAVCEERWG